MKAVNLTTQKELASDLIKADHLFARMKGLLGRSSLQPGEALLLKPCKGVHTFGMRFPIDVIILDNSNFVLALRKELSPNRLTPLYARATAVIELPAGTIEATATEIGSQIEIV